MIFLFQEKGTPLGTGSQRRFKRKHCNMSGFSDLFSPGSPFSVSNKRQSRDGALSSLSSATFESSSCSPFPMIDSPVVKENKKEISKRQQKCLELQHTERNYVAILRTIIKVSFLVVGIAIIILWCYLKPIYFKYTFVNIIVQIIFLTFHLQGL